MNYNSLSPIEPSTIAQSPLSENPGWLSTKYY